MLSRRRSESDLLPSLCAPLSSSRTIFLRETGSRRGDLNQQIADGGSEESRLVGDEEGEINLINLVFGVGVGRGGEAEDASLVEEAKDQELVGAENGRRVSEVRSTK